MRAPRARRRRLRRESSAARATPRARTLSAPWSAFASSALVLFLRSLSRDPRPERREREGRKWGTRTAESGCGGAWGTRLPHRVPPHDPGSQHTPGAPASWQAGRRAARSLALPLARTDHASSALHGQSAVGSGPSPSAPSNQHALSSVGPLAPRPTPWAQPPLISLLQSPAALGKRPTRLSQSGFRPQARAPGSPARPARLLLLGPQPKQISLRRPLALVNDFRDFPHPARLAPQAQPVHCSTPATHQATWRGGKPGSSMVLAGSWG